MFHPEPSPMTAPPSDTTLEPFACHQHGSGRGASWVSARGELDLATAPQFARTLREAGDSALLTIVDLRGLSFMDSSGVHAIMDADARSVQAGRRLVLVRGSGQVDRVLRLAGLPDRVRVVDLEPGLSETDIDLVV